MYIAGRDRNYRPIIITQASLINSMDPQPSNEDLVGMVFIVAEYIGKYMLKPGHVENMINIQDLGGQGIMGMPHSKIKSLLGVIAGQYKGKAARVFALNSPTSFSVLWQVVRYFIDPNTARKVQIISKNTCPELLELVSPNQLEQKYGGTAPNREPGEYWPPRLPDMDFGIGGKTEGLGPAEKETYVENPALADDEVNEDEFKDCE